MGRKKREENPYLKLQEEVERLRALVDAFSQVSHFIDLKAVIKNTLKTATSLMKARSASIALIDKKSNQLVFIESTDPQSEKLKGIAIPLGKGIAGNVAQTGVAVRVEDVHKDPRFYEKVDLQLRQKTGSYICSPLIADGEIIGTAQLMNRLDNQPFSHQDMLLLKGFANQAALAIQSARMHELMLNQRAFEHEMLLCAEIQKNLFPEKITAIPGYTIFGQSQPAREVGGDYYGYVHNKDKMSLTLADVSGKGLSASMLVSEFHTGYHLLSTNDKTLSEIAIQLNQHLYDTLVVGRFITAFMLQIPYNSDQIEYLLAGHPPPFLLRQDGTHDILKSSGPVIGFNREAYFKSYSLTMQKGDLLVAFSDGYSDACNNRQEMFGEERLLNVVSQHINADLPAIQESLQMELDNFREKTPLPDDATILLIRRHN